MYSTRPSRRRNKPFDRKIAPVIKKDAAFGDATDAKAVGDITDFGSMKLQTVSLTWPISQEKHNDMLMGIDICMSDHAAVKFTL